MKNDKTHLEPWKPWTTDLEPWKLNRFDDKALVQIPLEILRFGRNITKSHFGQKNIFFTKLPKNTAIISFLYTPSEYND